MFNWRRVELCGSINSEICLIYFLSYVGLQFDTLDGDCNNFDVII